MKKIISSVALAVLATSAFAQTKSLEERVEELELSRDLNWIKWGGSLETRYDYMDTETNKAYSYSAEGTPATAKKGGENDQTYRLWANLNMEAAPNDRLSFFGRLSVAKYFSTISENGEAPSTFGDLYAGQAASNTSAIFLERAFANYKITDTLTFTMGRLPTIDGPSKHIAMNQNLAGNYPTLAYSAILDGFALTKTFAMPESNSVVRTKFIHTPVSAVNWNGQTGVGSPASTRLNDAEGDRIRSTSHFYSFIAEYEKTNASWFRKNLTIFQWLRGDQNPFYTASQKHFTQAIPVPFGGGSTDITMDVASDLEVSVDRLVLFSEFEKIFHSNFDFAVQGMYSHTTSRGSLTNCTGATGSSASAAQTPISTAVANAACASVNSTNNGWGTGKDSDKMDGLAGIVTLRYQTPFQALNRPKIGAEYFTSSKKAYLYDLANVNPINMYQSQGSDVYHVFWNQAFDGGLYLNAGYMYQNQKMTRNLYGAFGDRVKTDNINQSTYVSLLATF